MVFFGFVDVNSINLLFLVIIDGGGRRILNMIRVREVRGKKANLFMTDEEVRILLEYSKRWSSKFQLMLAFCLFRGLRIGETLAINLLDFDREFTSLRVIFEKSHVMDTLPIIPELS